MKMFQEESGKPSSKRIIGTIMLVILVAIFIWKEFQNQEITNSDTYANLLLTAGVLLGITVAKHFQRHVGNRPGDRE